VKVLTFKPSEVYKGDAPAQVSFRIDNGDFEPRGAYLVFVRPARNMAWGAIGREEYGMIPLTDKTREAVLQRLAAHLDASDAKGRAARLMADFRGWVKRLKTDAIVDLYLEPALLDHVTDADRSLLLKSLSDPTLRDFFRLEIPGLVVTAGRIGGPAAFDAIDAALSDPLVLAYIPAFKMAMESLDAGFVSKTLLARFEAEKKASRLPAYITLLAELKVQGAFARVTALLDHEESLVREFAILGAGDLHNPASVKTLEPVLLDGERSLRERKLAVVALGYCGDPAGVDLLVKTEGETKDAALKAFIQTFRRYPARTRALLLKEKRS
jgi:hypothetical protein